MAARVFTVGRALPGDVTEHVPFRSDRSLFDADVVFFTPTFEDYEPSYGGYQGHPLISQSDSVHIASDCTHWRTEILNATQAGKAVFVALIQPVEVYHYTGAQSVSGTGRSARVTNTVTPINSYQSIPFQFQGLVPRGGSEIAPWRDLGPLAVYWNEFAGMSQYEIYFDPSGLDPLLGTKRREKVVGGLVRTKGGGALVLLPPLQWDQETLTYERGEKTYWRKDGVALGHRILNALVGVSDALRRASKKTPPPEWAIQRGYSLPVETQLRKDVEQVDAQMVALAKRRQDLEHNIEEAAELRGLLYETGKPLEGAVLKALRLLGFDAHPYEDGESEFDAIFAAPEGRFLGEAEGKDAKAVNIDKMSQLERNLQEDFGREEVTDYAKGVLFGNAFRLKPPEERADFFTTKCVTAAQRLRVALVRTPELFGPARYLSGNEDPAYATLCRQAIFAANGSVVAFPNPPRSVEPPSANEQDDSAPESPDRPAIDGN